MKENAYAKFLRLCSLSDDSAYVEQFHNACGRWCISEEEIEEAVQKRIPKYYRVENPGIRRLLGLYIEEWLRLEVLKENKAVCIFFNVPGANCGMKWLAESIEAETCLATPDIIYMIVLYGIIGRRKKLEHTHIRQCSLNYMRQYLTELDLLPVADIRWTFGHLCNEAPCTDRWINEKDNSNLHICIVPEDKHSTSTVHLERQIFDGFELIKKTYPCTLERDKYDSIRSACLLMAVKIEQIMQFMRKDGWFKISNADVSLIESLLLVTLQKEQTAINEILDEILHHMKKNTEDGQRRIVKYFVPNYTPVCNPQYSYIFERNQIALLFFSAFRNRKIDKKTDSSYALIAAECLQSLVSTIPEKEIEVISDLIKQYKMDGLLSGMFAFDPWLGRNQEELISGIKNKTGCTIFTYEIDFWNQTYYSAEDLESKIKRLK